MEGNLEQLDLQEVARNFNELANNLRSLQKAVERASDTMQELNQALLSSMAVEEETFKQ